MVFCVSQGWNGWNGYIVLEDGWSGICVIVVVIEDDIIDVNFKCGVDVFFDMLCGQFVFNWNVVCLIMDFVSECFYLIDFGLIWEVWGGNC